ncbi:putative DEAD/DEAH box helicase [Aspergillus alliaceus]|uniref:putative DEAD/DEAH box helicase n=1 Tax=Petromyces alliaceus TaxID=209559 RepID=UPI0012A4581B|nr:uncharacterized protein BDW43DRAFT_306180 [Aspergillus alliaceus]KAB8238310.1 hypothetical protein BDW43DRAFT_306180 [Aspergillus alliaceus]
MRVRCFETYRCDEFAEYLASVDAYFLMCHDGAVTGLNTRKCPGLTLNDLDLVEDDDSGLSDFGEQVSEISPIWETSAMLRSMVHHFICHGYNVSLINSLEFRDAKAMAMVVEGSAERARQLYSAETAATEDYAQSPIPGLDVRLVSETTMRDELVEAQNSLQPTATVDIKPMFTDRAVSERLSVKLLELMDSRSKSDMGQREIISVLAVSAVFKSGCSGSSDNTLSARSILLHTIILCDCKLNERTSSPIGIAEGDAFLNSYIDAVLGILTSAWWQVFTTNTRCDIGDMIDGRLFYETLRTLRHPNHQYSFTTSVISRLEILASFVKDLCGVELEFSQYPNTTKDCIEPRSIEVWKVKGSECPSNSDPERNSTAVMPFNNPVLDPHLSPVSLAIDSSAGEKVGLAISRISEERSHWLNHRKPLSTKAFHHLTWWQLRRNQFFMAEMRQYAASLTNSGTLDPETVVVKSQNGDQSLQHNPHPRPGALSVRGQVAAQQLTKRTEITNKHRKNWESKRVEFDKMHNYAARYVKVVQYLQNMDKKRRNTIETEVLTYGLSTLVHLWIEKCSSNQRDRSMSVAALIWSTLCEIAKKEHGVTEDIVNCLKGTISKLCLPAVNISAQGTHPLSFQFAPIICNKAHVSIGLSFVEFQLVQAGPYLDRSMGSAPDPRVHDFEPDRWQRDILDQIDTRKSLFVVAPTSSGKTFISYVSLLAFLEDDNDGVLVYVAPTKALVNQIAAEVQARFSKSFKDVGKSVWAIHTRDYRINNPTGCQVLITVPHILQIMLLAPANANPWSSRVKRIIFDEIHCIGQADDGVVWEQLLLLSHCPIIALSATVGNPQEFSRWLELTQRVNGNELKMIEHKSRYSDLRKYSYHPPDNFVFNGFSSPDILAPLGLDNSPNMSFIHPVASLIDRSRGIPDDLTLEPRDCWTLWIAMEKCKTAQFPIDKSMNPSVALPAIISKADIIQWENKLKALLKSWMNDDNSPFGRVLKELSYKPQTEGKCRTQVSSGETDNSENKHEIKKNSILDTTLPLICSLHDQGALPALIFNYDRSHCERICHHLLNQLEDEESRWKESSSAWKNKKLRWEAWKKAEEKGAKLQRKNEAKGYGKISKDEQIRDSAFVERSKYSLFDPKALVPGYHLADIKKLSGEEFEEHAKELKHRHIPEWLIGALRRGIGVHHAGMNRKYRQVCEVLFRKGYLRVVVATGTLALGINMPCKTVVFSGDSIFLTALGFRQAAGRAGRRGFDFLGNVVFQGVPYAKVCRLLSSKLPSLNGHFPITTSLVLRLLILLHESKQAPYAVKAINSILSCPRIYLGGPESKHTVLHHLRFSIEYLRRNYLLEQGGAPLNFSNIIAHLYYTGNSSFAFHALLSGGYFHNVCKGIDQRPNQVLLTLMLVMSHLFGRHYLRPAILESHQGATKSSPSVVILPPMPEEAARILRSHNEKTLDIYSAYVTTYIEQHVKDIDSLLPLTNLKCGGDKSPEDINPSMPFLPPTQVTSSFVALSGHRDKWVSISELCKNVRSGVWLEQTVVPYVGLYPEEGTLPLNAYLFDFFKHGNVHALENDNMIRKGDIWFLLNDFSLVLATIVTSLENFLHLSPIKDPELLNTMGSGDVYQEELDINLAEKFSDFDDKAYKPSKHLNNRPPKQPSPPLRAKPKKPKVADSWEDEVSDEESDKEEKEEVIPMALPKDSEKKLKKCTRKSMQEDDHAAHANTALDGQAISWVLEAFRRLQAEFDGNFKATWA